MVAMLNRYIQVDNNKHPTLPSIFWTPIHVYSFEELQNSVVDYFIIFVTEGVGGASNIYELMLECWLLAFVISSSFISLRLPVFATPPVTLAATTSLRYPRAPTLVL